MKINAEFKAAAVNEKDEIEITFVVKSYKYQKVVQELQEDVMYRIDCEVFKPNRTVEQNTLMWRIIREISKARESESEADVWSVYVEALKRAGVKYEYVAVLPQAEPLLRKRFRAIQYTNSFKHKGKTFDSYRVFCGSSELNTKEMHDLINILLDMAAEEGIYLRYDI